jgi:two-component sensor histidine kinase
VRVELRRQEAGVELAITDSGTGVGTGREGTGLSIVSALVRDELRGSLDLRSDGDGTRAAVVFPA